MKLLRALLIAFQICESAYAQKIGFSQISRDTVEVYSLTDKDRRRLSIESIPGDLILIDFWATWCSPCLESHENLKKYVNANPGKVSVVTISGDDPRRFFKHLQSSPNPFFNGLDSMQRLFKSYQITSIPTAVLLNRSDKSVRVIEGKVLSMPLLDTLISNLGSLPDSVSPMLGYEQVIKRFSPPDTLFNTVTRYPVIEKSGTFSFQDNAAPYLNRRITFVNFTPLTLYRYAHNVTYLKTVISDSAKVYDGPSERISLDVYVRDAVKDPDPLRSAISKYLKKAYPLLKVDRITKEFPYGFTLQLASKKSIERGDRWKEIRGPRFACKNTPVIEFVNYLEEQLKTPVVYSGNLSEKLSLDLDLDFSSEQSLVEQLQEAGLLLKKKEKLPVELLYFEVIN